MKHLSEYGPEFTEALNNIKLRIGKDKPKKDRFMEENKTNIGTGLTGSFLSFNSTPIPEPTIPLSEVFKFARFANERYDVVREGWESWDGKIFLNSDLDLWKEFEIFRSGKENLND